MAIVLYRKGNTHNIRGVLCERQTFSRLSYKAALDNGWSFSPEEVKPLSRKKPNAKVDVQEKQHKEEKEEQKDPEYTQNDPY